MVYFLFPTERGGRGQLKNAPLEWRRHWSSVWYSPSFSCSWFHSKQSIFLIASWVESLDLAANFVGTVKLFIRFNAFWCFFFNFFWLQTLLNPQTSPGANMLLDSLVICKRTISRCQICYKIFLLFPSISLSIITCALCDWMQSRLLCVQSQDVSNPTTFQLFAKLCVFLHQF